MFWSSLYFGNEAKLPHELQLESCFSNLCVFSSMLSPSLMGRERVRRRSSNRDHLAAVVVAFTLIVLWFGAETALPRRGPLANAQAVDCIDVGCDLLKIMPSIYVPGAVPPASSAARFSYPGLCDTVTANIRYAAAPDARLVGFGVYHWSTPISMAAQHLGIISLSRGLTSASVAVVFAGYRSVWYGGL